MHAGRLKRAAAAVLEQAGVRRIAGDKAREPGTSIRDGLLARLAALGIDDADESEGGDDE